MVMLAARRAVLAAALLCVAATPATARDGDASGLTLTTREFTGIPRDVVVSGDLAHVALDTGIATYDIGDPANPIFVSHVYLPSAAFDVALEGDHLLVADGESGLVIINVTDPVNPTVIGRLATQGTIGVAVSGSVAFLAEASSPALGVFGLRAVNIADPTNPVALGFLPLANGAIDVTVAGGRAYVGVGSDLANSARGLAIVDVTDPSALALESFVDVGQPVNEVALNGFVAYLAAGFPFAGSLVAVDVLDATNPSVTSRRQLADAATGISIGNGVAHVAAGSLGVLAFDVTGPTPMLLDALTTGRQTWSTFTRNDIVFVGERASAGAAGFTIMAMMPLPQGLSQLATVPFSEALDVAAAPGLALMLRRDGLAIFDNTMPFAAPLSSWTPSGADFSVLAASSSLAAVGDGRVARIVDIADPTLPSELSQISLQDGVIVDMEFAGDTLFIANGRGLDTFSVASPSSPSSLGTYRTSTWASAIAVDADRACLVAGTRLEVLDVSSPSSPSLLGSLDLGDALYGVALAGDLVVVTGYATTLATIDITDPTNPVLRASIGGGLGLDVILANGHAIVASGEEGVKVFDVRDAAAPLLVGSFDTSGRAVAVAIDGSALQVATSEAQHWILDCPACVAPCSSTAQVLPPTASICEGETLLLDGSGSSVSDCPGGAVYQWFQDNAPIPGATLATYDLPTSLTPGSHQFRLTVTCSSNGACQGTAVADITIGAETFPVVGPASLRVLKVGGLGEAILSWSILSGAGRTNVHRSEDVLVMRDSTIDAATVVAAEPTTTWTNDLDLATPSLLFFKVFGRRECSGLDANP